MTITVYRVSDGKAIIDWSGDLHKGLHIFVYEGIIEIKDHDGTILGVYSPEHFYVELNTEVADVVAE